MKEQNTEKKLNTKIWIAVFVLIFVLLYVYIYVVPHVTDIFVETYVAEYGILEAGADAECLFVRDEQLYRAQSAGNVERVLAQGKLVRRGSKIVALAGKAYYNESRGIVSYFYDGMEDELSPDTLETIRYSQLEKTKTEEFALKECKQKDVSAGDCIFKIADNTTWYLCAWLTPEETAKFSEGSGVTVDFNDGVRLKMSLRSVTAEGEKSKLVLSCNRYYEFFDKYRTKECRLIRSSRSGILLEAGSITELDGQSGVYVKDKFGSYNFVPVSILAQNEDTVAVEKNYFYDDDGNSVATVNNYDEILKNPDKNVKESDQDVN